MLTLFYILGLTFGLILHDENINMVKGHNIPLVINLKPLTIHHEFITFHIHDGYHSIGEHRMNNASSVPLALQFPLFEGFKPRNVEDDLISFFEFLLLQSFVIPPFNSLIVYRIFVSF
jgi:hypothetical protein